MHISLHIGAHCTDGDCLVKSLSKNKKRLTNEGVIVPRTGRYRQLLSQIIPKLDGARASRDTQEMILEAIMGVESAERLVLSHAKFLGAAYRALEQNQLYFLAARNTARVRNLFPDYPVEFFLSVRNPATFIPALYERTKSEISFEKLASQFDPRALYWSYLVQEIREANTDSPITVWCNEDTPLIWKEVLHEVTGLDPLVQLKGGLDIMGQITARDGMRRLREYMEVHPPQNEIQRRRILSAFLDKFGLDAKIEEELDLPGWSQELVDELSASYNDDMLELKRIPGVTLLTP